jgi:hypothetical protein
MVDKHSIPEMATYDAWATDEERIDKPGTGGPFPSKEDDGQECELREAYPPPSDLPWIYWCAGHFAATA